MDTDYFNEQLKLNLYNCNAVNRDNENIIHLEELNYVDVPCSGLGHNIIDCNDSKLEDNLVDVQGLNFNTVTSKGNAQFTLPYFIPIISKRLFEYNVSESIAGVTLRDIFNHYPIYNINGASRSLKSFNFRDNLLKQNCFRNKKVILFSSGKDCLIEEIWKNQEMIDFYNKIRKLGFDITTSINFSLFQGECPMAHALNLKKSLITFEQFQRAGIKCIPHVYWTNNHHLNRWIDWLQGNPDINCIAYNCQMSDKEFSSVVDFGIRYILKRIPYLHILLEGPKQFLLHKLKDISGSIHVATRQPSEGALNFRRFYYDNDRLSSIKHEKNTIQNLFDINCHQYKVFLQKSFYGQKATNFIAYPNETIHFPG